MILIYCFSYVTDDWSKTINLKRKRKKSTSKYSLYSQFLLLLSECYNALITKKKTVLIPGVNLAINTNTARSKMFNYHEQ